MSNEINSLSIIEQTDMTAFKATMGKIGQFQKLVRENLQDGKDFGTIPGTSKPTLFKPGAEKILMLMGLQSTYEIIDSTRDWKEGFFQYQVRCTLKKGDVTITQGLGSCNSKERKYMNQSGFNIDNTILKMAKKRSQVDASLTVASLSEIFTQDLEDTGIDSDDNGHNSNAYKPKAKSADKATDKQISLIKKQIISSHLLASDEVTRLEKKVNNGLTKLDASNIISWWLGDDKKGTTGERDKRESQESLDEDQELINAEEEGNTEFPFSEEQKRTSKG